MAISFFGRSCYERCVYVRKNNLKIPINTSNFTEKKIHFQAFSTTLFRVYITRLLGLVKSFINFVLVSSRSQMFCKRGIPKYSEAVNAGAL